MATPGPSGLGTDWQLGCMELKQRGGHLLQTGQWSDCVFLVGTELHPVKIPAHKLILASASPVFEAMFYGRMAEGDGPIQISDVHPDAFKTLLLYIYTDQTVIGSFDKACAVYYAAKKYMLPYLEKECLWFISLNLDPQNVCPAYELALLFDENLLVEKCLKIFESNTKEVLRNDSFMEADIKTLYNLLLLDHLEIDSELDLFRAVEKYARTHISSAQLKRRSDIGVNHEGSPIKKIKLNDEEEEPFNCSNKVIEKDKTDPETGQKVNESDAVLKSHQETAELVPSRRGSLGAGAGQVQTNVDMDDDDTTTCSLSFSENSRESFIFERSSSKNIDISSVRACIGNIRFLTLSAAQFAAGPARSPLLSESEAFAVLMNILSSAADTPMPRGFCTSRLPRNQQNISPEIADSKSEAVFRFTVLNFKSRRRSVESRVFQFSGAAWSIKLVPRFETDTSHLDNKFFGLYLKCGGKKEEPAWSCRVKADVRLLAAPPHAAVSGQIHRLFTNKDQEWGFERFVSWESVLNPERGLLRANALTIEARLLAGAP